MTGIQGEKQHTMTPTPQITPEERVLLYALAPLITDTDIRFPLDLPAVNYPSIPLAIERYQKARARGLHKLENTDSTWGQLKDEQNTVIPTNNQAVWESFQQKDYNGLAYASQDRKARYQVYLAPTKYTCYGEKEFLGDCRQIIAYRKWLAGVQDLEARAHQLTPSEAEEWYKDHVATYAQEYSQLEQGETVQHTSALKHMEKLERLMATQYTPIPTHMGNLDSVLNGGLYAGLYVVGAMSSMGKTTYCLQMADSIARSGHDVLIMSLEMSETDLMSKSLSRLTASEKQERFQGLTAVQVLQRDTSNPEDADTINKALDTYRTQIAPHLYIIAGIGCIGVDTIAKALETHRNATGRTPVIIIDYVQILAPTDPTMTDKRNMDIAVVKLKTLANDYQTPVIAVSSFNRDGYKEDIQMSSFKESGGIEYTADVLIGLDMNVALYDSYLAHYGKPDTGKDAPTRAMKLQELKRAYPRPIQLKVLKNRFGAIPEPLDYDYYPDINLFTGELISVQTGRFQNSMTEALAKAKKEAHREDNKRGRRK